MDNSVSCDWRVRILNCEGSFFFTITYSLGQILLVLGCLAMILSLFVRKCLLGEPWKNLAKGENLFLIICLFNAITNVVYYSILFLGGPPLVASIFWSTIVPTKAFPIGQLLKMTLQAIPDSVLNPDNASFSLTPRAHARLLFIYAVLILIINTVMIPLAYSYLDKEGSEILGKKIEQSALTITAINTTLFSVALVLCCNHLKRRIQKVIGDAKQFSNGEMDHTLLLLTIHKLKVLGSVAAIGVTIDSTFYLLLAFYPRFFTNMAFSKALAVIMVPGCFLNLTIFFFSILFLDVKRWIYAKQMKENSSSKGSKKEESVVPSARLSNAGKDQVDFIINDLQQ